MSNGHVSSPIDRLSTYAGDKEVLNAVIETPKGCRSKFDYDPELGLFKLGQVLPAGAVFPFDFGFVPGTLGEDGDPLDVLVLMDESAFPGCLVPARLIGAIKAEQTEEGRTFRNDRLIAVAEGSHRHRDVTSLQQVGLVLVEEIEHFFVSYNQMRGKIFRPQGCLDAAEAHRLVRAGMKRRQR